VTLCKTAPCRNSLTYLLIYLLTSLPRLTQNHTVKYFLSEEHQSGMSQEKRYHKERDIQPSCTRNRSSAGLKPDPLEELTAFFQIPCVEVEVLVLKTRSRSSG